MFDQWRPLGRLGQRGFSLVELMVALLVGMMVIAALSATFLASSISGRHGQAMAQMTEDASTALTMLRGQVSQVGYSRPKAALNAGRYVPVYAGEGLRGCHGGAFQSLGVDIAALACVAGAANSPDALAVAYEADARNSVSTAGVPLDCLGNALPVAGVLPDTYYLAYNRYYLATPAGAARPSLYCRGAGSATPQALVENIADLQIRYGVANLGVSPVQAGFYGSAGEVGVDFSQVVSVRICVVVTSTNKVMEKNPATSNWPTYLNCDGVATQPTDGYMYRAFTSTVVLPNRLGVL
jgi:type IV pilus assembly protein PilW